MDNDPEFIEGLAALADLDDEEELEELREAASFNTETYRILKDVGFFYHHSSKTYKVKDFWFRWV